MDTHKQIVSVFFFSFSIVSILFFSNEFDLSFIISLLSETSQLITRRNMILLCHFILLFIVKDSGLLSPRRNESSVSEGKRVVPLEKEHEIVVKGAGLERKEEIGESCRGRSLEMVVMEKRELVSEGNGEDQMEVTESNEREEHEDLREEVEEGKEIWELMEIRGEKEEMEKETVGLIVCSGEDELEKESVEEFNRKIEEFIEKFKQQRLLESQVLV